MKAVRLRLPGEFEDVFLYMGRLLLVTTGGSIQVVRLSGLLDSVARGRPRRLLRPLFEQTNHLNVRGLVSAAGDPSAVNHELSALTNAELIARVDPESEFRLGVDYVAPLDLLVYYRRLYFATDQGLFSRDIDFDAPVTSTIGTTSRRTEPACLSVTARYGTIHASCEDEGLFQSLDEFGWLEAHRANGMARIAPLSRRTSWLNSGFVNYLDHARVTLFQTTTTPVTTQDGEEAEGRRAITSVEPRPDAIYAIRHLASLGIEEAGIRHIWSSLSGLFVQLETALIFVRLSLDEDGPEPTLVRLGRGFDSVIWAGTFGRGTVVETDDSVVAFENHQQLVVEDRPVIATRTFPNSIRYKRLVATILEDSVVLTSVVKDYMLQLED